MRAIQTGAGVSVTEMLDEPGLVNAVDVALWLIDQQRQKEAAMQKAKGRRRG